MTLGCAATHLGLTEDLQAVLADELQQLAVGQAEELLFFGYLGYVDTSARNSAAVSTENPGPDTTAKEPPAGGFRRSPPR